MIVAQDIRFSLTPVPSLHAAESLWRSLEPKEEGSFFTSWTWIGTWLGFLPKSLKPMLLVGSRDGKPIGAAILVPRRERRWAILNVQQYHFNATGDPELDCIAVEHNGFVGTAEANRILWPAFLRWMRSGMPDADELVIPGIVDHTIGPVPTDVHLLQESISKVAFATRVSGAEVESILADLSRNARQQLRQSIRRSQAFGELECEAAPDAEVALTWFGKLKEFHIQTWGRRDKPHAFRYGFFEIFHRRLIAVGFPGGSIQFIRVTLGGEPIGYLYNLRRGERFLAYQSGFDDTKRDLRPGYLSHVLAMVNCQRHGGRIYDFLAGENRLKRTFCKTLYTMHWQRLVRPRLALRAEWLARSLWNRIFRKNQ